MAIKKQNNKGLSGNKKTIRLFYDGDKYKDPVFVGINGMTWLVQRGVDVEVPEEVYEVLIHQQEQDQKTSSLIAELSKEAKEIEA
jgi:exosome complex RNA-binding protein Rrp4